MQPPEDEAITVAMTAQQCLAGALALAGFEQAEFPQMYADVDVLDMPCVRLGSISVDTAGRLAEAITRERCPS